MSNTADRDQTAPEVAVRSGSALFAQIYLSQYSTFSYTVKPVLRGRPREEQKMAA